MPGRTSQEAAASDASSSTGRTGTAFELPARISLAVDVARIHGRAAEVTVLDPSTLRVIVPPHPITSRGKSSLDCLAENVDVLVTTEHDEGLKQSGYAYRAKR
ncbi:MAG: hypothetical protein RL885_26660 [Planctomycetota bacterium]